MFSVKAIELPSSLASEQGVHGIELCSAFFTCAAYLRYTFLHPVLQVIVPAHRILRARVIRRARCHTTSSASARHVLDQNIALGIDTGLLMKSTAFGVLWNPAKALSEQQAWESLARRKALRLPDEATALHSALKTRVWTEYS